jgi:hypothetical protein
MAKSGILHIGLPKTGTTSCQEALFANREMLLRRHRMFYPSVAPSHNSMLSVMFLEDPRTNVKVKSLGITTREGAEALRRRYFAQMEANLAQASWDTLVLSSEGLSTVPLSSLERLRDWLRTYADDWTVLFWARHPVAYTTSNIQQHIKSGRCLEDAVTKPPMTQFRRRASDAFQVFGRENVKLTAFEEARQEPGGIVAAFCRRLGLPETTAMEVARSSVARNESMSLLATLLLSSLNRQRPRFVDGQMNPERREHDIKMFQRIKGEKFRLPPEAEMEIRQKSRTDVEWLNETFGTELYLDVFSDQEPDVAVGPGTFSPETLDSLSLFMSDLINGQEKEAMPKRAGRRVLVWWRSKKA